MEKLEQVHLGTSREVKTEQVAVTVLGLTNGLIKTFYSDFLDGLLLQYSPGEFHTITTLFPLHSQPVNLHVVWESDLDGRHIKIFSREPVMVTWRYDTRIWLSDADFALDRCLHNETIQKAARQFKNLTLESYAKMVVASTLDIIAAYQRRWKCDERSVCGDACYLFQGDGKLTKDCIRASPMRREQLEGVALVGTPHGDYALRTGAKAMYSREEGGVWHIDAEGEHSSVPPWDTVAWTLLYLANAVLPPANYVVSLMQQRTSGLLVSHIIEANAMLKALLQLKPWITFVKPRNTVSMNYCSFSDVSHPNERNYGQTGIVSGIKIMTSSSDTPIFHTIDWTSHKQVRVSCSSYGAEILAAATGDDRGFYFKSALACLFPHLTTTRELNVDSRCLFDTIACLIPSQHSMKAQNIGCAQQCNAYGIASKPVSWTCYDGSQGK